MAAEKNNIPYKIYLSEDEMPKDGTMSGRI